MPEIFDRANLGMQVIYSLTIIHTPYEPSLQYRPESLAMQMMTLTRPAKRLAATIFQNIDDKMLLFLSPLSQMSSLNSHPFLHRHYHRPRPCHPQD